MAYASSDQDDAPLAVKILIAGGFGVGKTTMVGAVSEVAPLRTEEYLTHASVGVDDLDGVSGKSTTTVALDFGRITINRDLVLYLFGTPGRNASGSCGTTWSTGPWARSSWSTPGGWT